MDDETITCNMVVLRREKKLKSRANQVNNRTNHALKGVIK